LENPADQKPHMVKLVLLNKMVNINDMFIYNDTPKFSPRVKNDINDLAKIIMKAPKKINVPKDYGRKGRDPIKFSILDV
jgi:hypothetical protein